MMWMVAANFCGLTAQVSAFSAFCLQCFDAVCFLQAGCPSCRPTEWWGAGVVVCLEQGADLHKAQLMPLPLTGTGSPG